MDVRTSWNLPRLDRNEQGAHWRCARGVGETAVRRSLREIGEGTGLSRRAVQDALKRLVRRRLVEIRREGITEVGEYRFLEPWRSR